MQEVLGALERDQAALPFSFRTWLRCSQCQAPGAAGAAEASCSSRVATLQQPWSVTVSSIGMHPAFSTFARAFRASGPWAAAVRPVLRARMAQFVCCRCRPTNFSTTSILRNIARASKNTGTNGGAEKKYPNRLLIYHAGETRTTFVAFWKAMALLQFGTCSVFLVPLLYKNENQPDHNVRLLQAVAVGLLGTVPTLAMSYLTAPFVRQVFIQIPDYARVSRDALMAWARTMPDTTRLEFTTLRIFPFERLTACILFELRALPPQRGRFANIALPKSEDWVKRQREKRLWRRVVEVLNEPRHKFYVKEGKSYTIKSGAPGVWETVMVKIKEQTTYEGSAKMAQAAAKSTGPKGKLLPKSSIRAQPVQPVQEQPDPLRQISLKRQTARQIRK